MEPHWRSNKAHRPPRPSLVANLSRVGKHLGTPCGNATQNQGRLLQVNISWIWQKRCRVKSFHWMAKMLDVGFSKPFIIYIAEKSNQRGNIWYDKFYLNLLLVMGDSSSFHKGSQEKNVAYPRSRTKCLLASNVTVMQLNKHFSIHFKVDLNLMLMLGHFMDVYYPCIIIITFTKCFLEVPTVHGVNIFPPSFSPHI